MAKRDQEIAGRYRFLKDMTERMLACARAEDWDGLVEVERERGRLVQELGTLDTIPFVDSAAIAEKREAIETVLEMDAEIRRLAEAWRGELHDILSSLSSKKNSIDSTAHRF